MPWLEDVATLVIDAGAAALNTTLFLGTAANIPTGAGPYLIICETAGLPPERLHSDDVGVLNAAAYERPGAQLTVRAVDYTAARTMARAAYNAVDGIHNQSINGTWYREILASQRPFDMGPDDAKRVRVVFNILCVKALS